MKISKAWICFILACLFIFIVGMLEQFYQWGAVELSLIIIAGALALVALIIAIHGEDS